MGLLRIQASCHICTTILSVRQHSILASEGQLLAMSTTSSAVGDALLARGRQQQVCQGQAGGSRGIDAGHNRRQVGPSCVSVAFESWCVRRQLPVTYENYALASSIFAGCAAVVNVWSIHGAGAFSSNSSSLTHSRRCPAQRDVQFPWPRLLQRARREGRGPVRRHDRQVAVRAVRRHPRLRLQGLLPGSGIRHSSNRGLGSLKFRYLCFDVEDVAGYAQTSRPTTYNDCLLFHHPLPGLPQSKLALEWREWLTRRLTDDYFRDRSFYQIQAGSLVDNPDQRISSDIRCTRIIRGQGCTAMLLPRMVADLVQHCICHRQGQQRSYSMPTRHN